MAIETEDLFGWVEGLSREDICDRLGVEVEDDRNTEELGEALKERYAEDWENSEPGDGGDLVSDDCWAVDGEEGDGDE